MSINVCKNIGHIFAQKLDFCCFINAQRKKYVTSRAQQETCYKQRQSGSTGLIILSTLQRRYNSGM